MLHWGVSGELGGTIAAILKTNSSLQSLSVKADSTNLADKTGVTLAQATQNSSLSRFLARKCLNNRESGVSFGSFSIFGPVTSAEVYSSALRRQVSVMRLGLQWQRPCGSTTSDTFHGQLVGQL